MLGRTWAYEEVAIRRAAHHGRREKRRDVIGYSVRDRVMEREGWVKSASEAGEDGRRQVRVIQLREQYDGDRRIHTHTRTHTHTPRRRGEVKQASRSTS